MDETNGSGPSRIDRIRSAVGKFVQNFGQAQLQQQQSQMSDQLAIAETARSFALDPGSPSLAESARRGSDRAALVLSPAPVSTPEPTLPPTLSQPTAPPAVTPAEVIPPSGASPSVSAPAAASLPVTPTAAARPQFKKTMSIGETQAYLNDRYGAPTIREITGSPTALAPERSSTRASDRGRSFFEDGTVPHGQGAFRSDTPTERQELSMAEATSLTGGDRRAARALVVESRLGLDSQSQQDAQFNRQLELEGYRNDLRIEAQNNQARIIKETSDQNVIDQVNAMRQADGQDPLTDPADARAELFQRSKDRITMQENALQTSIDNASAYQQQVTEEAFANELSTNSKLSKEVATFQEQFPGMSNSEALAYIAQEQGSEHAEAAAGIIERAPQNALESLAGDLQFQSIQRQQRDLYDGLIREARATPGISTSMGIPTVEPMAPALSPEAIAEIQAIMARDMQTAQ